MKAVVADAQDSFSVVDVDLAPPKTGEGAGADGGDGRMPLGSCPSSTGRSRARSPPCSGMKAPASWRRSARGVTNVSPGDHVILSFIPHCGEMLPLRARRALPLQPSRSRTGNLLDGDHPREPQRRAGVRDVLPRQHGRVRGGCPSISVVPMAKDVPFQAAALIGCGVTTGVGAAVKTAAVRPGSTVAVWGCGGVASRWCRAPVSRALRASWPWDLSAGEDGDGQAVRGPRIR